MAVSSVAACGRSRSAGQRSGQLVADFLGQRLEVTWRDRQISNGLEQPGRLLERTGGRAGDDRDVTVSGCSRDELAVGWSIGEKGPSTVRAIAPEFVELNWAISGEELSCFDFSAALTLAVGAVS